MAVLPFVARPFLDLSLRGLDELSAGVVVGSFAAALLLFAPPVVLLGMVAPFAVRLSVRDVATAGAVAGRLYALSTAGSLLGTFAPALVTIPLVGTQRTLLGAAAMRRARRRARCSAAAGSCSRSRRRGAAARPARGRQGAGRA